MRRQYAVRALRRRAVSVGGRTAVSELRLVNILSFCVFMKILNDVPWLARFYKNGPAESNIF